jgi:hypothetical protein
MQPGHPVGAARITAKVLLMKLGFICLNVPGHLNPMTALARQLQARGHDVVFLYSSGAAGLPFVPAPERDHISQNRREVSKMQGEDALQFSFRMLIAQTQTILKSLPATVTATGVEALPLRLWLETEKVLKDLGKCLQQLTRASEHMRRVPD